MSDNDQFICTRCGSPRVLSQKIVRQSANPLYPITVNQYKCTDPECQAEIERKQAALTKERLERLERSQNNHNKFAKKAS